MLGNARLHYGLLSAILVFCVGCGAAIMRKENILPIQPRLERLTSYEVGETYTVAPGEPLVRITNRYRTPAYTPAFEYDPPNAGIFNKPKLIPGQVWWVVAITLPDSGYILRNLSYSHRHGIHILPKGVVGKGWAVISGIAPDRVLMDVTFPFQSAWTKETLFVRTDDAAKVGSFQCELTYSGVSGSSIRILYREYIDNMARPAFSQELTYDLKQSPIITYKSVKIEVLKADNSSLTYRVIDDGGLAWVPVD